MFEGRAEEAMRYWVDLFDDAEIVDLARYGPEGPGAEGTVHRAVFRVAGRTLQCIDSPAPHEFGFTPAVSFFVECDDDEQFVRLHAGLADGGTELMPPGDYGFSRRFTWVQDRFGVSWQLNLA